MLTVGQIRKAIEGLEDDVLVKISMEGDHDQGCDYDALKARRSDIIDGLIIDVLATEHDFDEDALDDEEDAAFFERVQADEDDHEIDAELLNLLDRIM